jgi:hypothetical protein
MKLNRPVTSDAALRFAVSEFGNGTRYWPRLIVAFCEQSLAGGALAFCIDAYEKVAINRGNEYVSNRIQELKCLISSQNVFDSSEVRHKSAEIWADTSNRSIEKRGVTRLYNAISFKIDDDVDEYEVELTRALSMSVIDESGNPLRQDFLMIAKMFKERY